MGVNWDLLGLGLCHGQSICYSACAYIYFFYDKVVFKKKLPPFFPPWIKYLNISKYPNVHNAL